MARRDSTTNRRTLAPGMEALNSVPVDRPRVAEAQRGSMVPKKSGKGGAEPATAFHRVGVMRSGDNMGARRRIDVKLPGPQSPEAGMEQRSSRIVRAVMGQKNNFWDQAAQKW